MNADQPSNSPTTPPPTEPPPSGGGESTTRYPAGSPPPAHPGEGTRRSPSPSPAPSVPALTLHATAHIVALPLILAGVLIPLDETMLLRTASAWAGFVLVAVVLQLTPLLDIASGAAQRWTVGAAGTAGLILFWVSIVQPSSAASTSGFCLTMGVAAAAVGTFTSPHRRWPAIPKD